MRKRPGRHRARAFARAVDGSGAPHPSVSRLVSLANALRGAPLRGSSPRSGLRQQLMLEAAARRPVEHRSLVAEWLDRLRFQRGLASTTVLCTVLIAVAGIGFGTTESLPGDTLYSMKLRSESVQLAFIGSDEQRGRKNLKYADARLNEIIKLVRHDGDWPATAAKAGEKGDVDVAKLINKTFATMDASTAAGAKAMRKAFERTGDTSPLAYLDRFTREQQSQLRHVIPTLPTESKASASDSLAFMGELSEQTAKILGTGCQSGSNSGSTSGSECGDGKETSAASSPTTPSDEPGSTSPSTSASSPTASDETGTGTSAVPPATGSTGESTTGTGSGTSSDPSDTGSSGGSGSSTGTPTTGDGSSDDDSSSTGSTSGTPEDTPSSEPPEPTGVPSDPSGSGTQSKSDTAASAPDDGSRQSAPAEDHETASTTSTAEPTGPPESDGVGPSGGDTAEPSDTP